MLARRPARAAASPPTATPSGAPLGAAGGNRVAARDAASGMPPRTSAAGFKCPLRCERTGGSCGPTTGETAEEDALRPRRDGSTLAAVSAPTAPPAGLPTNVAGRSRPPDAMKEAIPTAEPCRVPIGSCIDGGGSSASMADAPPSPPVMVPSNGVVPGPHSAVPRAVVPRRGWCTDGRGGASGPRSPRNALARRSTKSVTAAAALRLDGARRRRMST